MRRRIVTVAVFASLGLLAAACGTETTSKSQAASTAATATSTTAQSSTTGSAAGATTTGAAPQTGAATTGAAAPTTQLPQTTVALSTTTTVAELPMRPGAKRMHFEVGPLTINPGQNNIDTTGGIPQPTVDGWIVGINPNLRLADGTVPPVDVVHLHHGVWLNVSAKDPTASHLPERFFAAGEEKTILSLPAPFGYKYSASDKWLLNYMLHNLLAKPTQVWVTYDIDFIPADAPQAQGIVPARPVWLDVQNGSGYPVFDVLKGTGTGGTYTYPTDATKPYAGAPLNQWTVDRDGVLITTAVHLHPGGLYGDLSDTRNGKTAHLFKSDAKYYEPAGAVSWDVAMTATPQDWRVAVKKGDTLSITATYDSALASWYESMGIMVVWMADTAPASDDPFTTAVDKPGMLTHGHLKENDNHGGKPDSANYEDLTTLPSAAVTGGTINIQNFLYEQGDMSLAQTVPTVKQGGTLTFTNLDSPQYRGIWHTITACKAPCNKSTGIAYPLADGAVNFDSGELGIGGPPTANRDTWTVPNDLAPGTYTYFCRIHPLMRGAFRVEP